MKNRPDWCPHKDCKMILNTQNAICSGELPQPVPHGNDENTHRWCFDERETGHGIHDMMINKSDAWWMSLHLDKIIENTIPNKSLLF